MDRLTKLLIAMIVERAPMPEIEEVVSCSRDVLDLYKKYGIEQLERKWSEEKVDEET